MSPFDRVMFSLAQLVYGVSDVLRYSTHRHRARRRQNLPNAYVEECWCRARRATYLGRLQPGLPAGTGWQIPPVDGWPSQLAPGPRELR